MVFSVTDFGRVFDNYSSDSNSLVETKLRDKILGLSDNSHRGPHSKRAILIIWVGLSREILVKPGPSPLGLLSVTVDNTPIRGQATTLGEKS